MRKLPFLLFIILSASFASAWNVNEKYKGPKTPVTDTTWHPDILKGYEARFVNQGIAFDGPCRSTIIRKLNPSGSRKAFLYVHGFNDYFFQSEMGERFVDSGFNFYAVDLRRYGRSKEPWQYPFNIRKQEEYFDDIDSALAQIRRDGNIDITLGGHSTGGLTVAFMGAMKGKNIGVDRIVTDSPFLEWNFNSFMRNIAAPTISFLGKIFPNAKHKQGHCDGYAYSLLKEYYGEWTYNTDWKMIYSPPVTYSWVGAINSAQSRLMKKRENIAVPILVMHSSRKIDGCNYTPEFQTGDAVLDPFMLQKRGEKLGKVREVCTIDSGLHDLILSRLPAREAAYDTIFSFIRRHPQLK
ncbi:MAG: alpha/beta hydrolase [Muribaculaceae bacterium]|nr:alpha/beta hydrolase [Muribaculaceae bacterium]MDE6792647.1 alpha/beta hydrolase [Muribaculaceae bacterium]